MQSQNKILLCSTVSLVMVILFGFIAFSTFLRFAQTALRERNLMKNIYLKLPIPLTFSVYFFNISNPEGVMNGESPVLKEIGPYCYNAYKEKIDVMENSGEDSLSYTPYETYFFNEEKSGNLSQEDYVTVLHPLVVGVVNTVVRDSPPLLPIINKALKSIFLQPRDIYITTKVRDLLFDGITVNCVDRNFTTTAVCMQIKSQLPGLVEINKNLYKFSVLGPRNGTLPNRFKILRGMKKSHELGRLVEVNHEKELKIWKTKRCNRFRGTDGWIFPPFVNKDKGIWSYSPDLCRNIQMKYVEDARFEGIFVEKYFADLGDMSANPEDKCYCPKSCLPKGVMDLTKCMGVPIYATLPHFLKVDRNVRRGIKGLKPNLEKHSIRVLMQPLLGVPLEAEKRMQFNLPIQPNKQIEFMQKLPKALHPIFWIEEAIVLEGGLLTMIKAVFIALNTFNFVKYGFLVCSIIGMAIGAFRLYQRKKSLRVTPLIFTVSAKSSRSQSYMSQSAKKIGSETKEIITN